MHCLEVIPRRGAGSVELDEFATQLHLLQPGRVVLRRVAGKVASIASMAAQTAANRGCRDNENRAAPEGATLSYRRD